MGVCCDQPGSIENESRPGMRPQGNQAEAHPYGRTLASFKMGGKTLRYYSLPALGDERYAKLPYSIRVLLESAVRNCDNFNVKRK